jgi:hypothetical protein
MSTLAWHTTICNAKECTPELTLRAPQIAAPYTRKNVQKLTLTATQDPKHDFQSEELLAAE